MAKSMSTHGARSGIALALPRGVLAALPVVLALISASSTAVTPVPSAAPPAAAIDAPRDGLAANTEVAVTVAEILGAADRVVAIHELPGAVAFDLLAGDTRWQLTVALDDDGVVVDTALAALGRASEAVMRDRQRGTPRLTLPRVDRIDLGAPGHLVLRGGARALTVALRPS